MRDSPHVWVYYRLLDSSLVHDALHKLSRYTYNISYLWQANLLFLVAREVDMNQSGSLRLRRALLAPLALNPMNHEEDLILTRATEEQTYAHPSFCGKFEYPPDIQQTCGAEATMGSSRPFD